MGNPDMQGTAEGKAAKKSAEEKREEARDKIKMAAVELFYLKGYENTTTRDIVLKTGILNGSIYNRFKNKEDILLSAVTDALHDFLEDSKNVFSKLDDPMSAIILPAAIELYLASSSPRLADIIYNAHRSWAAVCEYVDIYEEWFNEVFSDLMNGIRNPQIFRVRVSAIIGAVGNVCAQYAHGFDGDYRGVLNTMVRVASSTMEIPVFNITELVDRIANIVESGDVYLGGRKISEIISCLPKTD